MKHLAVTDLAAWLADGTKAPPVLLDVREPWEYEVAHLHDAVLVPMRTIPAALETAMAAPESAAPQGAGQPGAFDPARPIVCICHHGARSMQVAAYLERAGVRDVYNLTGGIDAWSRQVDPALPTY